MRLAWIFAQTTRCDISKSSGHHRTRSDDPGRQAPAFPALDRPINSDNDQNRCPYAHHHHPHGCPRGRRV